MRERLDEVMVKMEHPDIKVPHLASKIKHKCSACGRESLHSLKSAPFAKIQTIHNIRGRIFFSYYECGKNDCRETIEVKIFVAFPQQTEPMFSGGF